METLESILIQACAKRENIAPAFFEAVKYEDLKKPERLALGVLWGIGKDSYAFRYRTSKASLTGLVKKEYITADYHLTTLGYFYAKKFFTAHLGNCGAGRQIVLDDIKETLGSL